MKSDNNNHNKIPARPAGGSNGTSDVILHKEILIPKYNEYPFEKGHLWAKRGYAKALPKVDKRKAKFLKRDFQIRTADYVEKMTFGKWRLIGPPYQYNVGAAPRGRPNEGEHIGSPLQIVLDCLKPYISIWGKFRVEFVYQIGEAFKVIHNSDYLPDIVKDRNEWIPKLLAKSANKVSIKLDFVLHPETMESYNSPRFLEMRSKIWEHFTGEGLDKNDYIPVTTPIPGRPIQMEMHLELSITETS
jgi:hypothetical protein